MKLINTRIHAGLDYLTAIFLMASPWIFQLHGSPSAHWTMIAVGMLILIVSIFTDYEGGVIRAISMPSHLSSDFFVGAFIAASPWIFGFAQIVFLPQLIIGIFILIITLLTSRRPYADNPRQKHDEQLNRSTPVDSKLTD